jgi:hypothetical protein
MVRRYLISCTFLLATVACGPVAAAGQGGDFSAYAPIHQRLRPSLDSRLKLYVELDGAGEFERLYDLFSGAYIAHLKTFDRGSKTKYAAFQRGLGEARLAPASFTSTSTKKLADGVYIIFGSIKSRWGEKLREEKGSIEVRQNGDWYFSEFGVEVDD